MNSEVKRRVLILSIGIIGMISLIIGISFAAFSINFNGTKENVISSGCLKVEMSDNGSIVMDNSFPIEDEEGLKTDAYTYTIENTCNINAYYEATLNAMEGTTLANLKKVKVALSGDSYLKPTFEDDLDSSTLLNNDSDVLRTYRLDEGYLKAGETKTFNLRTWIDYDVEQISGKIENKVIIQSEARTNNTLVYNTKTIGYFSGSREQLLKNVDYKQISSESGIVESKNNTETSYYFRGTPTNTVVFGTYNTAVGTHSSGDSIRWKILNTNSDGSVNLITEESIGNSTYSNVQNLLTSFYNTHLQDEETYIKTNSTFCKEGATSGEYLAKLRTESNNPTSKCNGNSTFTKIGLPTVDDLMYAGAVLDKANTSYYLYNGNSFMTGTQSSSSTIYASNASKSIYETSASASLGVRPVITIKKDTLLSGNGTAETPYYVSGTYETPSTSGDTNKPVIVYARVEEKWSKTNKQIEISAKDNNTIAGYIVKTTNTIPGSNDTGWEAATSNKYKTVNTFDNGTYYVFAKDAAGNVSDPEQVKVERVDKVAPTCTINIISETDKMNYKTLSIESEDENIDLKGYSWTDDEDIKTSTRKVSQSGVYTAHLKDLAGNQGTCDVTIGGFSNEYEVEVIVNNGTVDTSKKFVTPNSNATFNLTSNQVEPYHAITECTNDQNGSLTNNVLTVSNVTSDTTCTVTYKDAGKTTLFTDGTLIINEKASDRASNITLHGAVTNEYEPMQTTGTDAQKYIFGSPSSQPWNSQKTSITKVEIGQKIQPTDTKYWFSGLTNMTYGDFTNLDTSSVTNMYTMFFNAGNNSSVTSFILTGLDNWDTSKVTDMGGMFYYAGRYATTWSIGDLSNWNTSKVTDMSGMFNGAAQSATTFDIGNLSNWDTSKVTSMQGMFSAGSNATIFNIGDLSNWDTSKVTSMQGMFSAAGRNATIFDIGNLSNWNVSSVTDMSSMFLYAGKNATTWSIGDLSNWDTSKVTNMSSMFSYAGANASNWNSIGTLDIYATNITSMFAYAPKAKATLNIYSSPTNYSSVFFSAATDSNALIVVNYNCGNTVIDNIIATKSASSNVVKGIEFGCSVQNEFPITLDAQGGTIPSSTGWTRFGDNEIAIKPYTTNSTYGTLPTATYRNYEFLGWYTKPEGGTKVTSSTTVTKTKGHTLYAHYNIPSWTVNVLAVNGSITGDTSKTVKDYTSTTFNVSTTLENNYVSSVTCTNGQTGSVTNNVLTVNNVTNNTTCTVNYTDSGSTVLYTDGTLIINEKASDRSSNITEHGAVTNEYAPMSNSNNYVFSDTPSQPWNSQKTSITKVEIGQTIAPTNTGHWFSGLTNMTYGDFTNLDTSQVTSMYNMFYNAGNNSTVTSFTLTGLDDWDTSKVRDSGMVQVFSSTGKNATTFDIGDLSSWDTSKVTNMSNMFSSTGRSATTWNIGDLSNWDTSKVTNMQSMFSSAGYSATTWNIGDLSNWNVSKVTNMESMFSGAGLSATTFDIGDIGNWDVSKVTNMSYMFNNAGANSTTWNIGDLSNWNVSNVTNMSYMFSSTGRSATTWNIGDLSNWNTSKVTNMSNMFYTAGRSATTWSIGNLSDWDTSNVTNMSSMFFTAGLSATTFDIGDIGNWDVSKVTNMSYMFNNAGANSTTWNIGDLSNWNVSNVTNMNSMFSDAGSSATTFDIGDLSNWDTLKVTDMSTMFYDAGRSATTFNSIGTLDVYATSIYGMFRSSPKAKATLNIYSVPTSYSNAFDYAATDTGALITLNYNCTTIGVIDDLIATKSSNSNVVRGTSLEGSCPDRTINVTVTNGTVDTSSTVVPNLGNATFNLTPTSGYSYPSVSCTNNQKGSITNNVLTVSNVVADTTCTVRFYQATDINLTDNDATYPWINSSGVWKSGNYNVNSTTSTITSESFTLTSTSSVAFDWAVSSESASYDYLYYTIYKNGTAVSGTGTSTKIGGNNTVTEEANLVYTTVTKELEPGTYTIAFSYRKDGSQHKGLDRGYVKNLHYLN